jgi:Leucine-rich repeat (LRR) protein
MALTQLWLSNNQLNGTIPTELGALSKLTQLFLYNNQLNGSIPSSLGLLDLSFLYLYGNQLSGKIPSSLGASSKCTLLPGNGELCRAESFTACEGIGIPGKAHILMM